MLGGWLITALALAIAGLAARRLAVGVGAGLFTAALSGLLLLNYTSLTTTVGHRFILAEALVGLAVLWFVVAIWVERETTHHAASPPDPAAIRVELAVHAAAVAGVLALAALLSAPAAVTRGRGVAYLLIVLFIVAAVAWLWRRSASPTHATIGLLLAAAVLVGVPPRMRDAAAWPGDLSIFLAALALLIIVVASLLGDWRRRVRRAHEDPLHLLEAAPRHNRLYALVLAAAVLVGLAAFVQPTRVWPALATGLAAIAVSTIGHRWRSNATGELGLALAAETAFLVARWLPASPATPLLGVALAGLWMLWLAGFWRQQLDGGRPWTTAGGLIPRARGLAHTLAFVQLLAAACLAWGATSATGWQMVPAVLLMVFFWLRLMRDAASEQSHSGAFAACAALSGAVVAVWSVANACAANTSLESVPAVLVAAAGGVALALRSGAAHDKPAIAWVYSTYVAGIVPLAVLYDLTLRGTWTTRPGLAIGALALTAAAVIWRWGLAGRRLLRSGPHI